MTQNSDSTSKGFVLVTGSSTGIGRTCATFLANRGFSVLASVRRPPDGQDLERLSTAIPIRAVQLDVADANSIAQAVQTVQEIVGDKGMRGLVNNAGIAVVGPIECIAPADWRRQFDVNFFGQIAVTQSLLPLLRQGAKVHGSARIILMSSIAAQIGLPLHAPYCASKRALESFGDSLRLELWSQAIQVSYIEPGAIQSEIWRKGHETADAIQLDESSRQLYGRMVEGVAKAAQKAAAGAIPAERVAKAVLRCLMSRNAPRRIIVGPDAKFASFGKSILPTAIFDRILRHGMNLD